MTLIKAPDTIVIKDFTVFLSGSIEMGKAVDWQTRFTAGVADLPITVLNPRRDDWDSSWVQSIDNHQFRVQVEWELNGMDYADLIIVYFDPATKSPITLLELGLHAKENKMIVCCPEGFWRKGNVDIVCTKYHIPQAENIDQLIAMATERVKGGYFR